MQGTLTLVVFLMRYGLWAQPLLAGLFRVKYPIDRNLVCLMPIIRHRGKRSSYGHARVISSRSGSPKVTNVHGLAVSGTRRV